MLELLRSQRDQSGKSLPSLEASYSNGENLGLPVKSIEEFNTLNRLLKEEKHKIEFVSFV